MAQPSKGKAPRPTCLRLERRNGRTAGEEGEELHAVAQLRQAGEDPRAVREEAGRAAPGRVGPPRGGGVGLGLCRGWAGVGPGVQEREGPGVQEPLWYSPLCLCVG